MNIDRAIIANADSRRLPLGDGSVHMIATSPPYWGLRDYGTDGQLGLERVHDCLAWARGDEPCGACYVCHLREWAAEMWRVLRNDGVMFLNLGDSYAAQGGSSWPAPTNTGNKAAGGSHRVNNRPLPGLKPKDLVGIPWRVALALQADGWYLRSDIIWAKPNPMPESVTDRPTKSHEYIFLLTKSARYYWDAEAVKEKQTQSTIERAQYKWNGVTDDKSNGARTGSTFRRMAQSEDPIATIPANGQRNLRSVWNVATQPYSGAHFATWPEALVETMVKAGTSERGVCPECGKPWERVVEKGKIERHRPHGSGEYITGSGRMGNKNINRAAGISSTFVGHRPTCAHDANPVPAVVLDPFAGSGTTLLVARRLGRIGVGFDLSLPYLRECAAERLGHNLLRQWGRGIRDNGNHATLPLFAIGVNDGL